MKIRSISLATVVGIAGALAAPAWAGQASDPAPAPAAEGLIAVRDAETGQLRAPTAEEAAALATAGKSAQSARGGSAKGGTGFLAKRHASGAVGARANDDIASYSVIVRQPDGTTATACVESKSAAEQAVQSGVLPVQQATEK